jgi:hypothetical protein
MDPLGSPIPSLQHGPTASAAIPHSFCAPPRLAGPFRPTIRLLRFDSAVCEPPMYNIHGFPATLREVAGLVRQHLPEAWIAFEWDRSEAMRVATRSLSYEIDATAGFDDFGFVPQYPLDPVIADFIADVRAEETGCRPYPSTR